MPPFPSIHGLHLDRVLGTGNSGTVYAARQSGGLELEVAVKVIHPHLIYSELDARFEVEKAALASLRHPGIAHVLDSGTSDEGLPYLVMERVDGQSIDEYCDRNRLGVEERLEVFLQAAAAVEAAHLQGILHRDLKPANILLSEGEALGEVSLLLGERHTAGAHAIGSVSVASLDEEGLRMLTRQQPDIAVVLYRNLAQGLGHKLRRADLRIGLG